MIIKEQYLTPNNFSRSATPLKSIKGIVIHWVGNAMTTAEQNRNYFEILKNQTDNPNSRFAGAHFIISLDGEVIQCIPDNEVAYHVGAFTYTKQAIKDLSTYPNNCTLGIELCHTNWDGEFTQETINSAKDLILMLCEKYNLGRANIYRHFDITSKDCPRLFVAREDKWNDFLNFVFA